MLHGAPAGIVHQPIDPGIFPDVSAPSEQAPEDLRCDLDTFRNYAGVEDHATTEGGMRNHMDKHHVAAFDTIGELREYVGGEPILSKLGIIEKVRNGVTSARTILDTKESGVKYTTAKTQHAILPRLFDAVLSMLLLLPMLTDQAREKGWSLRA